jgi:hypothetical protein
MFEKYGEDYELVGTELFILHYYGMNVFFEVDLDTYPSYIYIHEVETDEQECYDTPLWDKKIGGFAERKPEDNYIIEGEKLKVVPELINGELCIPIPIPLNSPVIQKAKFYSKIPVKPGIYYANFLSGPYPEDYKRVLATRFMKETITEYPA